MKMAKLETAIRTVIDLNKAFNRHDIQAMLSMISDGCIFENPDPTAEATSYSGRGEISRFLERFFTTYPLGNMEIEEIFGFSIHCVMRWHFDYVDALGASHRVQGVDLSQVKNALICEKLTYLKK